MYRVASTVLACAALLGAGCTSHEGRRLNAGGSTFVYPMMSLWTFEYEKATTIQVNYQSIGSGGGIRQMTARTFDFGCTDGPMNAENLKKAHSVNGDVIHVPLCMGAVVPAYNLPGVSEPLQFTGPVLADIYLGKITKWNDPALRDLNPGANLPEQEIIVVRRSDGSGTTYVWVDYLAKVSPEWKQKVGVGTSVNWPVGIGQKGGEGVAGQVRRSPGSLGYIELTYALHNDIPFGLVRNKEGVFVRASLGSVTAAADAALTNIPDDLRYSITDAPGKDSYPISGTVWAVVYVNLPPAKGRQIRDFLWWVIHDGQPFCEEMDYARLPEGLVKRAEGKLNLIRTSE